MLEKRKHYCTDENSLSDSYVIENVTLGVKKEDRVCPAEGHWRCLNQKALQGKRRQLAFCIVLPSSGGASVIMEAKQPAQ